MKSGVVEAVRTTDLFRGQVDSTLQCAPVAHGAEATRTQPAVRRGDPGFAQPETDRADVRPRPPMMSGRSASDCRPGTMEGIRPGSGAGRT